MTGTEQVLIEDWCQQYPSHSIGGLAFGADGSALRERRRRRELQLRRLRPGRQPRQPVRRPARRRRRHADSADRRGRRAAQPGPAHRRRPGEPRRHDPPRRPRHRRRRARTTRWPAAATPTRGASSPTACATRSASRPAGHDEVWVGDVGWNDWEEIDRVANPTDGVVDNFGWPCYEGDGRQAGYDAANLNVCENLYDAGIGAVTPPYFRYHHDELVVPAEACPTGGSSVAGISFEFYDGSPTPPSTTAPCSSPTTPATASGSCPRAPTACPTSPSAEDIRRRRPGPRRPASRPER